MKKRRGLMNSGLFLIILAAVISGCASEPVKATLKTETQPIPVAAEIDKAAYFEKQVSLPESAAVWKPLVFRLYMDGFDLDELVVLFSAPDIQFDPSPMKMKLKELFGLYYREDLTREIQAGLKSLGYTPGDVDGRAGGNTRRAIKAFQQSHGITGSGDPSRELLALIQKDLTLPRYKRPAPVVTLVTTASRPSVYRGYLTPKSLAEAEEFYRRHQATLLKMEETYDVPAEMIVAILRVETNFGDFLGGRKALATLAGMALSSEFSLIEPHLDNLNQDSEAKAWLAVKAAEKGDWAYQELKALLVYALNSRQNPLEIPGSVYGAIGICQFMPSNAIRCGVDGNGDGLVDLFSVEDAIYSVGNYFRIHGWSGDMSSREKQQEVVLKYNKSMPYANTVLAVANHLSRKYMD